MSLTITLGWWVAPTIFTAAVFAFAFWRLNDGPSGSDLGGAVAGMFLALLYLPLAAVASLAAWLIWALVT